MFVCLAYLVEDRRHFPCFPSSYGDLDDAHYNAPLANTEDEILP